MLETYEVVDLPWASNTNCTRAAMSFKFDIRGNPMRLLCDADSVDANFGNGGVDIEEIHKIGSERIFGRESAL